MPALVRRLRRGSPEEQSTAASYLRSMLDGANEEDFDAIAASFTAAGAIPLLVQLLSSSQSRDLQADAAAILEALGALGARQRAHAIVAAGGLAPLAQLMRSNDADLRLRGAQALTVIASTISVVGDAAALDAVVDAGAISAAILLMRCRGGDRWRVLLAVSLLFLLARRCAERCQAIAAAGGAAACVELLARPPTPNLKCWAADVLLCLALNGESAAVVAVDPSGRVDAALQELHMHLSAEPEQLQDALRNLAAARAAPPRVCAAPGCGATAGRLSRCAGCGTVRYCSQTCQAAHWPAHRPECKRVRAERAAVAAAASGREAGPSRA